MAVGTNKSKGNAPKKPAKGAVNWEILEHMDGNAVTAAEFDRDSANDRKYFFVAGEEASEDDVTKCMVLNYIHCRLRTNTARVIPEDVNNDDTFEVFHVEEFEGLQLQVGVHFPVAQAGEKSQCFAVVKVAGKEVGEFGDANGTVSEYGDLSGALIEDVITPDNSRWMPRWQYVVKSLRARTLHEFYKDGSEIPRDEPEIVEGGADAGGDTGSQEIVEDNIAVYSGSIGQIIGPKGAKIKEIKDASKVVAINTPAKDEDGPRPKARDYVDVEIKGTQYNINKAKALIQAVVDEWANAPRAPRQDYSAPVYEPQEENNDTGGFGGLGDDGESTWDKPAGVVDTATIGGGNTSGG